ncbi:MAG: DUF488 family protein [Pseudonocardiaceae bacterium]
MVSPFPSGVSAGCLGTRCTTAPTSWVGRAGHPGDLARALGHGTALRERLLELLGRAGVAELVDVRTAPGSRCNPHVARDEPARRSPRQETLADLIGRERDHPRPAMRSVRRWRRDVVRLARHPPHGAS